jgi:hypothetical protein
MTAKEFSLLPALEAPHIYAVDRIEIVPRHRNPVGKRSQAARYLYWYDEFQKALDGLGAVEFAIRRSKKLPATRRVQLYRIRHLAQRRAKRMYAIAYHYQPKSAKVRDALESKCYYGTEYEKLMRK